MKILVTTALPYANGDIHLGHLAGCYLPADIYVRFQRLKKRDVIHIGGTDEHGVPITIKAKEEKASPKEIVDKYHKRIKESFEKLGILFDNFSRTTIPLHYKLSQDFFLKIYKKGLIEPKSVKQLYCPKCRMFLADRYVEGRCPHCGKEGARGDQCEACGRWIDPLQLISPRCKICGSSPEIKETKHWFFRLDLMQERLEKWLLGKKHWKDNVIRFALGWLREGLKPRAITRDLDWGVPVPLPEAKNKVLYVWFDAPIGYISSTIEWAEKKGNPSLWKEYWFDENTRLIHFLGKDNIVFHSIVWPAMLMAYGDFILPTDIPANEYLNIESKKLSSSRRWAVWVPEYLREFPPDPLRYALAVNLPENRDVDFTWKDFQARNNNELADILGNFVNRVAVFTNKYLNRKIKPPSELTSEDREFLAKIDEGIKRIEKYIENFEIKSGAREMMLIMSEGNRYFDHQEPWRKIKEDKREAERIIGVCWKLISSAGVFISPFIPFTAERINKMLGFSKRYWEEAYQKPLPLNMEEPVILFNKIEDEKIELQIKKLFKEKEEVMITLDDFKKLDIRIAKIEKAEKVEGTDKLLKLEINIGEERRTIVAGIATEYSPEELGGKFIVVICNLEPVKIRGIESNGMLLAAVDKDKISLLTVDKDVNPGTKVS